ncbi:RcnB family protein [Sphingobium sp. BYY-5]|uniref:RcnB family protein n=1 Tax=Sphingobium sp. BYY-5 TaxID=2926400 RepID=UPI001FA72D9D|nr:RcnB family protein [Sphingobium sp. BYY-5]MCI4591388.1 RcnB family protein [Sphingobium sp. BYY-5]
MRKLIILGLLAATVAPSVASAQSMGEVRRSEHNLREQQRDLRQAQRYGDRRDVRDARRDVRDARQDVREDWQDYRRSHRDVYRGGNWRAPFRYTAWNRGAQLRPAYYSSRYYIADPYRYRLPRPGANQQWVRHYNDVLLVNVRTGRVIDAHRGFFW